MDRRRSLLLLLAAVVCAAPPVGSALLGPADPGGTSTDARAAATSVTLAPGEPDPAVQVGRTEVVPVSSGSDGAARSYLLHVPDGLVGPVPLVVALHAVNQDSQSLRRGTTLERLARQEGFVLAYGAGTGASWNAGVCCSRARAAGVDDVRYLDEVIASVRSRVPVDPDRIALTGFSNGAMMALRYACERSEVVAAVAVVAGTITSPCAPTAPVAVLDLHGSADQVVPLGGGPVSDLGAVLPPASAVDVFRAAGGRAEVRVVEGAGHVWPDAAQHGVDAGRAVWDWVRDHPAAPAGTIDR